jgi:FkbM family methyltransferase
MNRSDQDSLAAGTVDIETIMQGVRQQILERELPGQVQLPQEATSLPPEYYEHLFRAALSQGRLDIELDVTPSRTPVVGQLIDRLRAKFHALVVFYVNQFAAKQAEMNNHLLQALSVLGRSEGDEVARSVPSGRGYLSKPTGEWASLEDVYACYRLLLGREPEERGWNYWSTLVRDHHISRAYLVDSFLSGHEFRALQAERNTPVLVELPDFKLYARLNDNFIGAVIARDKQYEPHVTRVLEGFLARGGVFVDVGANIGYFSLLAAARVGPAGRVFAFEPNSANCELLRNSAAANGFEGRIDLHCVAVAEARQRIAFATAGVDSNGRVINPAEAAAEVAPLPMVEAVALDDVLADCDRVDVIKIDTEGAEARVWRGMQGVIKRHRPTLLFEFSPILLRQTSEVDPAAFLEEVQGVYDLFIISPQGETAGRPDEIAAIVEKQAASGLSHLDILARPRGRTG